MPNEKVDNLRQNIRELKGEMDGLNDHLDLNPTDLFPNDNILPHINEVELFDYDKELNEIQTDCDETLDCLSSLYLKAQDVEKKNISNIISNDAKALAELKFSLSCSKRGLINLMKQLDMGINDPELYEAVGTFQKEIRDTVKMIYDIQKKMKDFYKDIRDEMAELNKGEADESDAEEIESEVYQLVDLKNINKQIDDFKKANQ